MMTERYRRIASLGWSPSLLSNSTILVVGAGALGNEVLKNLALLGLGRIFLVDMDHIETHNLTRTCLFTAKDIGKSKVSVAADSIRKMNPDVAIHPLKGTLQDVVGLGLIRRCDMVFGCLDNIQARIDLNRSCFRLGIPYIDGGLRKLDGDVRFFAHPYNRCFDCGMTKSLREEAWQRFSCLKLRDRTKEEDTLPTAPTIAAIIGGLQVQMAVKYLHGDHNSVGKRISVFGYIDESNSSTLGVNPNCPTHMQYEQIEPDAIKPLPFRSANTSIKELIDFIHRDFSQSISIALDYDLIDRLSCPTHGIQKAMMRKRGEIYRDEALCPTCLKEGKTEQASILRSHVINQIDGQESAVFLNKKLSDIGIPPLHILEVKAIVEGQLTYRYYEFSDDWDELVS